MSNALSVSTTDVDAAIGTRFSREQVTWAHRGDVWIIRKMANVLVRLGFAQPGQAKKIVTESVARQYKLQPRLN